MIYRNKEHLVKALFKKADVVLDVGFSGQGITKDDPKWPHALLQNQVAKVYGLDIELDESYVHNPLYQEGSAEDFSFPVKFDAIFASDLIEHLSNPGLFLNKSREHLKTGGKLILTTPNTFNLFNIAEKFTKIEPTVNADHTFYFNSKTLSKLLEKNGFKVTETSFLYTLEYTNRQSLKKKLLNVIYWVLSKFTPKFIETLVIVAEEK